MNARPLVCVVTCDQTWHKLSSHCFGPTFLSRRKEVDLAVVFNGSDQQGIEHIVQTVAPEYLLQRENIGYDLAGFDHGLKHTPPHETYILLHDDHWFVDDAWLSLVDQLHETPSIDVLGNVVASTVAPPTHYVAIAEALGYGQYRLEQFPHFLQGLAGFYKRRAIEAVLETGGVPHLLSTHRETTFVCERIHSFIMLDKGMTFGQIAPGYEQYLVHKRP